MIRPFLIRLFIADDDVAAPTEKFYWGTRELLLPVYASYAAAFKSDKNADVSVVVNFASLRSAFDATMVETRALLLFPKSGPSITLPFIIAFHFVDNWRHFTHRLIRNR